MVLFKFNSSSYSSCILFSSVVQVLFRDMSESCWCVYMYGVCYCSMSLSVMVCYVILTCFTSKSYIHLVFNQQYDTKSMVIISQSLVPIILLFAVYLLLINVTITKRIM
jgi:hypothetical protein